MLSEPLLEQGPAPAPARPSLIQLPSKRKLLRSGRTADCLTLYDRLPPQGAGISLAMMGCAGLLGVLATAEPLLAPYLEPVRCSLVAVSAFLQLVLIVRLFVHCNFVELESLHLSSTHSALLVALEMVCSSLPSFFVHSSPELVAAVKSGAAVGVLVCTALQLAIYAHFVHHIVVYRARPEPFWTPVMLFAAMLPLTWPALALPQWLRIGGLLFSWVSLAGMWPWCVVRMLQHPSKCADPSIIMLMAPVPFCTTGIFASGLLDACPAYALLGLWLLNVTSVVLMACGAWQRRDALRSALQPFQPGWVALTFPLCSNANCALRFWMLAANRGAAVAALPWAYPVACAYAVALLVATATLVPCVMVAWISSVPRWLLSGPPVQPGSISVSVPTAGSGAAIEAALRKAMRRGSTALALTRALSTEAAEHHPEHFSERRSSTSPHE